MTFYEALRERIKKEKNLAIQTLETQKRAQNLKGVPLMHFFGESHFSPTLLIKKIFFSQSHIYHEELGKCNNGYLSTL